MVSDNRETVPMVLMDLELEEKHCGINDGQVALAIDQVNDLILKRQQIAVRNSYVVELA